MKKIMIAAALLAFGGAFAQDNTLNQMNSFDGGGFSMSGKNAPVVPFYSAGGAVASLPKGVEITHHAGGTHVVNNSPYPIKRYNGRGQAMSVILPGQQLGINESTFYFEVGGKKYTTFLHSPVIGSGRAKAN